MPSALVLSVVGLKADTPKEIFENFNNNFPSIRGESIFSELTRHEIAKGNPDRMNCDVSIAICGRTVEESILEI